MRQEIERVLRRSIATLTTTGRKSGLPRDVEVYFAYRDGKLYFLAHKRSHWPRNLRANPHATLRIGGTSLEIRAVRVEDDAELVQRVMELFQEKYGRSEVEYWYKGTERWAVEAEVLRIEAA